MRHSFFATNKISLTAGQQTVTGTSGHDVVSVGSSGATVLVAGIEELVGGAGTDVVTISTAGATLSVVAIETLTGGAGTDVVGLAGRGATLAVSGIETLVGGMGADVVTVTSGTIRYLASGAAGETLSLAAGNGVDQVVLGAGCGEQGFGGFGGGSTPAFTTVANFQSGTDQVIVAGGARWSLDHNDDGLVQSASRAKGAIDLATDEVVGLTGTVASLTDANYANVRAAIGTLTNSTRAHDDVLVLASDGTSTGAYLVDDRNHDGQVGVSEISLLGVFKNTSALTASDIIYG